mgnify:CR=1 FL=1
MSRKKQAVIKNTTDYDKFTFIENNRETAKGHVKLLKDAFEEVGNLTEVQPILVNEKYQIIDGQHRFKAARELHQPIFYTVVNGLGINEARSMNILHRNWTTIDYARSYALEGRKPYIEYLRYTEEYELPHAIFLEVCYPSKPRGLFKDFREGRFEIQDKKQVEETLTKLEDIFEILPQAKHRPFAIAMVKAFGMPEYDHKRMVNKLRLNSGLFEKYVTVPDNQRLIETIYNYSMREQNRVRLY